MQSIVVLGGGLMGSSVAWQLSHAGEKVVLIEQQDAEYTYGSSFGEARICRSLGPKYDIWSYLHQRALIETQKLIDFLNKKSGKVHTMEDIYTSSPVTYMLDTPKKEAVKRLLRQQTDNYVCASTPEEGMTKFGMEIPKSAMVIQEYKKYTGILNPKALIAKLHEGIRLKSNTIEYNKKVTSLERLEGSFKIEILDAKTGKSQTIHSRKVVSAVGPYSGALLSDFAPDISKMIVPKRVFLAFLQINMDRYHRYDSKQKQKIKDFFPFIDLGPKHSFSMIEKEDVDGTPLFKIGGHFKRNEIKDLDEVWKKEVTGKEIEWSKNSMIQYFNFLNIPLHYDELIYHHGYSCVYSLTESEVPLVTSIPIRSQALNPNFILMGGFSGVGAKGSLMYGLIASHLLLKQNEEGFMYQKVRAALGFI